MAHLFTITPLKFYLSQINKVEIRIITISTLSTIINKCNCIDYNRYRNDNNLCNADGILRCSTWDVSHAERLYHFVTSVNNTISQ